MKISEFKKLEQKINNQSNFSDGYKNINVVMTVLSYFGHVASIFLAYFLLSKILSGAMTDNPVAVAIASIIILVGLEALKRDIFDKFSIQYLKAKGFAKDVLPLFLASFALISASFYASINGASEFASKEAVIEDKTKTEINTFKDSITAVYNVKIVEKETEIKLNKTKLDTKDKEQTELEAIQPPTRSARQRIKDLKNEKQVIRDDNTKLETDVATIKTELDTKIKEHETAVTTEGNEKKEDNNKNTFLFVFISTLIELVILAGVYFNEYYKFRSYREFRDKIEKDPNFQKWMLYDQMLSIIYSEDTRMNQKLPANKSIIDICKVNDIIVMPKDVTDFLKVINGLGIIKTSGSTRYINKQRDLSFEILKKHFGVN